MKKQLVLASGSPRRRDLLQNLGLPFLVRPAGVSEVLREEAPEPYQYAEILALRKARAVAQEYPSDIVLGADTIVILDNVILEKPVDERQAFEMLAALAGRTHVVVTGFALICHDWGDQVIGHEATSVHVRELSKDIIEAYVQTGEPMDKAGSYAIQGLGSALVEWVEGCFYNVVGLPVPRVARELESFGVSLAEAWTGLDRRVRPNV